MVTTWGETKLRVFFLQGENMRDKPSSGKKKKSSKEALVPPPPAPAPVSFPIVAIGASAGSL